MLDVSISCPELPKIITQCNHFSICLQALDEKVRERLRVSLEKNAGLEEELDGVREELHKYKATGAILPEDSFKKVCGETLKKEQHYKIKLYAYELFSLCLIGTQLNFQRGIA